MVKGGLMELGRRIRNERKKANLTLEDLAKQIGISKMTLQRIETGKTSPSIAVLGDIANALGAPITSFIDETQGFIKVFNKNDQFSIISDGLNARNVFPRTPLSTLNAETMAINYVEARNGAKVKSHTNKGYEWVFQLTGKSMLFYDGKEYIAKEGDIFFYDGRRPHSVSYMGKNRFLLISFK
jgi:XRE family transcriptional regulator, regulator of sulfur utilization